MFNKALASIGLLAFSASVLSSDLPRFDVEANCESIADGSNDMFNFCVEEEQKAYNNLKDMSVPSQTMDYCSDVASDSYDMLLFCIEDEMEAADNRQSFSFD